MTRTEKKGLCDLRNDENIVIKPSDKSKGFVVMSRESYMEKATAMLDCQINYERSEIKIEEIERCTRLTVGKLTENKLPVALANALLPANCRMSRFYGLPKDHKPGLPLRPVVSSCGSPLSNVSLLLERILNQLLRFVPAHLSSTEECVDELRCLGRLPEDCIAASLDVVSLYSNIPVDEGIDAVMELLEQHREDVDMFFLSLPDARQLLTFVLQSNYSFGESVYRQ